MHQQEAIRQKALSRQVHLTGNPKSKRLGPL